VYNAAVRRDGFYRRHSVPDWAVVLIAAFGGGLAGAVLQPLASHILERLRREEEIRKRRERHLRRMLSSRMAMTAALVDDAWRILLRQHQGQPMTVKEKWEVLSRHTDGPLWEPDRIHDPLLRQHAYDYAHTAFLLFNAFWAAEADQERVESLITQLDRMRADISTRMDELNWPEVDE
jgi:hypothetical protein